MTETVTLAVSGMKCGGCESKVTAGLQTIDGVFDVKASSKDNQVEVEFDPEKTDVDAIKEAITETGYTVE